ncbi:MAG: transglycosylase SLT domain-containing protein [Candidatus Latescibacterota bacterium]|nr:transglycosylase SLT domain-containing protein [Candidatus Latescibacterota bacterium]
MRNVPSTASEFISQGKYARAHSLLTKFDTNLDSLTSKESILKHIQLALCEQALNRPDKTIEYLSKISHEDIPELGSYIELWKAKAFIELKRYADAELALNIVVDSTKNPFILQPALNYLAQIYQKTERPNDAIETYLTQMKKFSGTRPATLWTLSKIYDDIEQPSQTRACYIKLLEQHKTTQEGLKAAIAINGPLSTDEAFHVAQTYFEHQKYTDAIRRLEKFVQRYPNDNRVATCHILLARSFSGNGQKDRAINTLNIAYKKYGSTKALYLIADILVKKNRDTKAITTYKNFAQRHPEHELADKALWQAAKAAERNGLFNESRSAYTLLIQHHPESNYLDDAKWGIGFSYFCLDSLYHALKKFQDLSKSTREPHIVDQSLYWAGKTAMRLRLDEDATSFFSKAALGFPRSYYSTKAVRLGYKHTAELNQTLAVNHNLIRSVHIDRGETLYDIGLHTEARQEYVRILRQKANDIEQLIALRNYFEDLGFVDLAVSLSLQLAGSDNKVHEWTKIYPKYYFEQILNSAEEAEVDPYLVLSVIRQESRFNKKAISRVGARGLMQIMPQTGKTLAGNLGINDFQRSNLFDPGLSIRFGAFFLGNQIKYFKESMASHMSFELSLAAYNAGPHNARNWLERFPYTDVDSFIERIPFKETRLYIKLVLKNYEIYKALSHV